MSTMSWRSGDGITPYFMEMKELFSVTDKKVAISFGGKGVAIGVNVRKVAKTVREMYII